MLKKIRTAIGPDARYDCLTVRGFTPKQYIDGLAAPRQVLASVARRF